MPVDPAGLAVVVHGDGTADLTWTPATDPGLLDYSLFRRTPSTGALFTPGVDTPHATGIVAASHTDSGLSPGRYDWQVFGRLWSPLDLAGLVAWYDASVPASITSSGGLVSQWNDLSGNGHHLIQATGADKPSTGASSLNGRNVLTFGASDGLLCPGVTVAQPLTIFAVAKLTNTAPSNMQIVGNNTNPEATVFALSGFWALYAGSVAASTVATDTSAHQVAAVFNGASSKLYRGGTVTDAGNPGTAGRSTIVVGTDNPGGGNSWIGDIAAVAIAAGDQTAQLAQWNSYCARWAL